MSAYSLKLINQESTEPLPISIHFTYDYNFVPKYFVNFAIPGNAHISPNPWKIANGYGFEDINANNTANVNT